MHTVLVCGCRGCGKSTYVFNHLGDDALAYDMDAIASAFRLRMPHDEYFSAARAMANDMLPAFVNVVKDYVDKVFIIRTAPSPYEIDMINPDLIVVCEHNYLEREMDDKEFTIQKLTQVKEYASYKNIQLRVLR